MIELCANRADTKTCDVNTKSKPQTIQRTHSLNTAMKFLANRDALFMIPELPVLEDHYSSSFTTGTKPRARKSAKKTHSIVGHTNPTKQSKTNNSILQKSLAKALSIVDSGGLLAENYYSKLSPIQSSQNSITTCSTAELTDEESDISSKDEKRESKEEKREAAGLFPKAPLLRGNRRWNEQNSCTGEEHFLYSNVRRRRSDNPPVCPVRRYE